MRLIDADELIEKLNNSHFPGAPYVDAGISIAIGMVCDASTIEPESDWNEIMVICDNCGHAIHAKRENCKVSAHPERKKERKNE